MFFKWVSLSNRSCSSFFIIFYSCFGYPRWFKIQWSRFGSTVMWLVLFQSQTCRLTLLKLFQLQDLVSEGAGLTKPLLQETARWSAPSLPNHMTTYWNFCWLETQMWANKKYSIHWRMLHPTYLFVLVQVLLLCPSEFWQNFYLLWLAVHKVTTLLVDGRRVRLQLWDTSGQGRFCTILRSYSRGAQGLLLVYDLTNKWSFDGIDRWRREVEEVSTINSLIHGEMALTILVCVSSMLPVFQKY